MTHRYVAIAHVWNNGEFDSVSLLDNGTLEVQNIDGGHEPEWLKERAALLRLCDININQKGELIGRKFTHNMLYVYLSYDEYHELLSIIHKGRVQ